MVFKAYIRQELKMELVKEYRFHPVRRWRFDYAFPELKVAIEVEGAVWTKGRHTRGAGYIKDMEKYNTAAMMGWTVIRVTPQQKFKEETLQMIKQAIISKKIAG